MPEFLRARLDEDEAAARAASQDGACWEFRPDEPYEEWLSAVGIAGSRRFIASCEPGEGLHIARHDPNRVLREVEAKRAILADHLACEHWNECARESRSGEREICVTLRALALPYSDHPDYDPKWKP